MKALSPPDAAVVHVTTRGGPFEGVSAVVIRKRALKMLAHLDLTGVELSVALVDDPTIQELNRTYRRKNKPTDVLAFPMHEKAVAPTPLAARASARPPPMPSAPETPEGMLGDVIVSIDTARRQATKHRRSLLDELTMLLAHGLLHLIGYDHQTDAEERDMTARTQELESVASARAHQSESDSTLPLRRK